ncbi:MAG: UvrD-helicase domain-containing protein, partial [bacterium]
SLKAIIDFTNKLFSRLMESDSDGAAWRTRYAPFTCQRANCALGRVEIILQPHEEKILSEERRKIDAQIVARRIRMLVDSGYQIYETGPDKVETPRQCSYRDIAILIRNRNQLNSIEEELRVHQIPFLVIGGTGFYQEPEIRYLVALTSFLIDPADDLALYITLRGPLFLIDEKELFLACAGKGDTESNSFSLLWGKITRYAQPNTPLAIAIQTLARALSRVHYEPLYLIIDRLLTVTRGWEKFWEPQRTANVKKFLQIIQNQELAGAHPYHIKNFLELDEKDEARADVTTIGMDVVQIMTVHAAKGLQFPIVFHPGLEEKIISPAVHQERLTIEEKVNENDTVETQIFYCPESALRKTHPVFQTAQEKQLEEEKRVFYVACTRARDALFLIGTWDVKNSDKIENNEKTKLDWLKNHLGLTFDKDNFRLNEPIDGVFCVNATTLPDAPPPPQKTKEKPLPRIKKGPVPQGITTLVRSVTRYTPKDHIRHHPESIALGDIYHRLFELISLEKLSLESPELSNEITRLLYQNIIPRALLGKLTRRVIRKLHQLKNSPAWEVIKPQPNSYAELPLMYQDGTTLWIGRIDRLILKPDEVRIYDYKTFPVEEKEIPALKQEYYENQLKHYAAACAELFPGRRIKTFLVFIHKLRIEPVG